MDRRKFLALVAGGIAGCTGRDGGPRDAGAAEPGADGTADPPRTPTSDRSRPAGTATPTTGETPDGDRAGPPEGELDLPVPESALKRGAPRNAIPAITDPAFGPDWSGLAIERRTRYGRAETIRPRLRPGDRVVGVVRNGEARAYPLRVLNYHEVVNDEFGGPLLVTYCPLCGSAVTAGRRVAGAVRTFGVSGLLLRSNLVLYDRESESLWSQLRALAIRGPLTGRHLSLVPSTVTTLREWRRTHPGTAVLQPPPRSGTIVDAAPRNYNRDPYAGYRDDGGVGIDGRRVADDRLAPKELVVGVRSGGVARAYPYGVVDRRHPVEDVVGDLPVVVAVTPDGALVAYDRRVDGRRLDFEAGEDRSRLRAGGSRWATTSGEALDGPHEGTRLDRANDVSPTYWFAWVETYPETEVYGRDGDDRTPRPATRPADRPPRGDR